MLLKLIIMIGCNIHTDSSKNSGQHHLMVTAAALQNTLENTLCSFVICILHYTNVRQKEYSLLNSKFLLGFRYRVFRYKLASLWVLLLYRPFCFIFI